METAEALTHLKKLNKYLTRQMERVGETDNGSAYMIQQEVEAIRQAMSHMAAPGAASFTEDGEPIWHVGLTEEQITEIILLIDDEPVDEELLREVRRKLNNKARKIRGKKREQEALVAV